MKPFESVNDMEIQTFNEQCTKNTTIYTRQWQCGNFITNQTPHKQTNEMTAKSVESPTKWGKIAGYKTAQDIAKMPTCVLNQLSSDKRFERLRKRSVTEETKKVEFPIDGADNSCDRDARDSLFNAEYNFVDKNDVGNSLGRSLIDSIRNTVNKFVRKEDLDINSDNTEWDYHSDKQTHLDLDNIPKFPKETKNATIIPISEMRANKPCTYCREKSLKNHQKHPNNTAAEGKVRETVECVQTVDSSLRNSKINDFKLEQQLFGTLKNVEMIPCPRNLLCDRGLHAGKCHADVRRKMSVLTCRDEDCACKKIDFKTDMWMGRANRGAALCKSMGSVQMSLSEEIDKCAINDQFTALVDGASDDGRNSNERPLSVCPTVTVTQCCHLSTMNGINGQHAYSNGDVVGGGGATCGGDIITRNQQKGCWTIGLINGKYRYLTAETFGFKINANGASLKKKQIWTLEPVNCNGADSLIYLRSHLDKYLAVDSFGNVTCESDERDPGTKFHISVADDRSGRWALKNIMRGYFLGSSADKLACTAKTPADTEFWHVHLAARPQMNLRSVGRKRFAHLSENLDEIHVDANIPWGEDTLFTLEFRLDESGKYAIHTCNNKYLSLAGKLIDQCTKDCLFSAEYHSGQLALRDRAGAYLSPIGSKAVLKTRSNTVTRDELFSLEDSLPQASFVANLNARFVSVKQGVDLTANQDEISDHETFQLEFDWTTKRWYIRTMQDRYWTLETGGGIQASGDKRSSNALFDLAWQQDGSVAFRANNGRYVMTKRSGHLYATADLVDGNSKYYFYLINRPILVLKCDQGFVGYKSAATNKLECNKATYECIQVERGEKGVVYFKGQNGKYWHVDSEGVTADADAQEGFHLELREPTRLCIKASGGGSYLVASKNGLFRLGDANFEAATLWEY